MLSAFVDGERIVSIPAARKKRQVVLERLGYCLDREHEFLHTTMGPESFLGLEGR